MKAKKSLWILCLACFGLLWVACNKADAVDPENLPEEEVEVPEEPELPEEKIILLSMAERNVADMSNEFGLQVFRSLLARDSKSNMLFSPLSLSLGLALCAQGGVGDTQAEILHVLGFTGQKAEDVAGYFQKVTNGLASVDYTVKFSSANSVWVDTPYTLTDTFSKYATDYFCADIASLDLKKKENLTRINEWCARKTEGMVDRILDDSRDPEGPIAVSYLLNALCFKGGWPERFSFDSQMPEGVFHSVEGDCTLTYLTAKHNYGYAETEKAQLVSLPYGNGSYKMVMALPREGVTMEEMFSSLTTKDFFKLSEMDPVTLRIPKFTVDYHTGGELVPILKELGLKTPFDPYKANFSGMLTGDTKGLIFDMIMQKSYITVDEKGTEAASVTLISQLYGDVIPYVPVPRTFIADRPFSFALVERSSNTILLLGQKVQ